MKAANNSSSDDSGGMGRFLSVILGGNERGFEEQRKRSVLAFFLMLGIATCLPFSIHHFATGNVTRAVILLFVASFQLASLAVLRYFKKAAIIFRLNVILLGVYFLFLIIVGGAHGSRIIWAFIFPLFSLFLLGKREGLFMSALLLLLSLFLFMDFSAFLGTFPYANEVKLRFLITYSILLLMSYVFEATRHKYQLGAERARFELEERVAQRTSELSDSNEQLKAEIRERTLAQEALKAVRHEQEIILATLTEFVLHEDKEMKIVWANRAACESAGVSPDEIVGRHCYEIWGQRQDICSDCPVQKAIKTGQPQETEKSTLDGKWWIVRGYPVRDPNDEIVGGIEVALDITERKSAEAALQEAYDIIDKSPAVAFLWKNAQGWPVDFVSENVKALLGYTAEELTAGRMSYADVIHPEDLKRVAEEVSAFSREEGRTRFAHQPYRIITKDGRVKWLWDSTFIRKDEQGRITHYQGVVEDITKKKETEDALRESETRYRTLVENSPAGIFLIDGHYRFVYANQELSRILGFSVGEIVGLDFRDVLDDESREFVADRYLRRQRGEDVPSRYEVGIVRKDGEKRRLEMVATAIKSPDGVVRTIGQVLDITEREAAASALRESEERFRELAENIREVFWLFDWEAQKVVYVSPAYEEIWGRSVQSLYDRYAEWSESIHPEDLHHAWHTFEQIVATGGGEPREYRIVRPDGSVRWMLDKGFAIRDKSGQVKRIAGIAEDITERKLTERELARHREHLEELVEERTMELRAAQEDLLKSERLAVLGQLTATVSHELRNPLGVIRSSLFYLQQKYEGREKKVKKHMRRIEEQVVICDAIVNDLLEYTRGRYSQKDKGEINTWLGQVLDEIQQIEGVRIKKSIAAVQTKVSFDPERMRRVIVNLVDNALQAVSARKQLKNEKAYRPEVQVSSQETDAGILIMVEDNGSGMDAETMKRAFEPLFTTKARGTGLGLAVVRKVIEEHNGAIALESEPNKGTRVVLTIPASEEC